MPSVAFKSNASDATDLTNYSFAGLTLPGSSARGTYALVGIGGSQTTVFTVSSVTVDGQAASFLFGAGAGAQRVEFWIAPATANATGTVAVNWGGAMARCAVVVWAVTGLATTTVTDSLAASGLDPSGVIDCERFGAIIGMVHQSDQNSQTVTWTGITEDVDALVETTRSYSAAHTNFSTPQTNLTVKADSTSTGTAAQMVAIALSGALLGNPVTTSSPVFGTPPVKQNNMVSTAGKTVSSPVFGTPAVSHNYHFAGTNLVDSSPDFSLRPDISQVHKLIGTTLATSALSFQTAAVVDNLFEGTEGITVASPDIGTPLAKQSNVLATTNVIIGHPVIGVPILNPPYVLVDLVVAPVSIGVPVLTETNLLMAEGADLRRPVIGQPTLGLVMSANSLTVGRPQLGTSKVRHFPKFIRIPIPQNDGVLYDPTLDMWPDLRYGRVVLMPARVGVDRRSGRVLVGWSHVVQSMQVIFATRYHERVLRRWVGSFVPHLLGDQATRRVITRFYWAIATSIDLYEPNYRIKQVRVGTRADGTLLTSTSELQTGNITTRTEGIYRPRAHLGDETPETRRVLGLVGRGNDVWDKA